VNYQRATAAIVLSMSGVANANDVAGVKLDERIELGSSELVLNGAGLRKQMFCKVYVVGLYLTEKKKSSAEVLALGGPKRLSITLMRDLPGRKLVESLTNGIRDNSSPEEQAAMNDRLGNLAADLLAFGQGQQGEVITFDWLPDAGTRVRRNGQGKAGAIPGDDLYCALLKNWLGAHPSNGGLKKALLGQSQR
jgi:Chalcone isomerase-like